MDDLPFDDLPGLAADLAAQVPAIDRRFADRAADRLLLPDAPLPSLLGPVTWSWKFYLVKKTDGGFFLRLRPRRRRQQGEQVIVDAGLELRLRPVPEPEPAVRLRQIGFRLAAPPFLVLAPSLDTLRRYAPLPAKKGRVSRDNTILLRTGPGSDDVLAVWFPDVRRRFRKARLWYRSRNVEAEGGCQLAPFIELVEAIRGWIDAGPEAADAVPFAPFSDRRTDADMILRRFTQAYCRATDSLAVAPEPPAEHLDLTELRRRLAASYAVADFTSSVSLRLDDDGRLATEGKEDEPFLLRLAVRLERDERAGVTARVSVLPPDFLVSGALHEQFMELVAGDAEHLDYQLELRPGAFRRFLTTARPRASVLRVQRKRRRDIDLIMLRGALDGRPWRVLLRSAFRVNATADPPVISRAKSYEVIYHGPSDARDGVLDDDGALYFKRLIGAIKTWMEAID